MKEKNKNQLKFLKDSGDQYTINEKSLLFGFIGICILIILSVFIDSSFLWGIHFLRFLPLVYVIISIILLCVSFVPYLTKYFDKTINIIYDYLESNSQIVKYILAIVFSVLFFYALRIKVPLLGDSYVLLNNMYRGGNFGNPIKEYLLTYFFVFLINTFKYLGPKFTVVIYSAVSIFSGVCFIFVIYRIALLLSGNKRERLVIFILSFFSGSSLLFFGYIESYPIIYLLTSLFFYFALRFAKERKYFIITCLLFMILLATHYASVMLIPMILYLIYLKYGRKLFLYIFVVSLFLLSIAYLMVYYSDSKLFLLKVQKDILNNLMISTVKKEATLWSYGFISWFHLIDYLNLIIVINPLFIVLTFLYLFNIKHRNLHSDELNLSFIGVLSLLFVAFMVNYPYGASKDWDIIAAFSLPINIFSALVLVKLLKKDSRKNYFFFISISIMFVHSMSYVLVYSMEDPAINRTKSLYDNRIMPEFGGTSTYLNIANYYNYLGMIDREISVMEESLDKFPKSARLFTIVSDVYSNQLHNNPAAFNTLRKAYANGAVSFRVYEKLGILAAEGNDIKSAINYWKEAVTKYGENFDMYFNIAVAYHRAQMFQSAMAYYLKADRMRQNTKEVLVNLVFCSNSLKENIQTKMYYDKLMQLYSTDQFSEEIRNKLNYLIKTLRK